MKRILSAAAVFILLLLLVPVTPARASDPLDEIKNYNITIDPRSDGTLDMTYHIDWLVLDSTSEGPLTWVKIGIPNSHIDTIKALSANIKSINYLSESGSYVRIDLDRAYNAGETVPLDFSFHQSYMYRLDSEKGICSFTFVPGWFDEAQVDSLKILWNKSDVIYSDSSVTEGNYIVWSMALAPGQRCTAIVRYNSYSFSTSEGMQADENEESNGTGSDSALIAIAIIVVIIIFIAVSAGGSGRYRGGFGGGPGIGLSAGRPGCAATRSCACASSCACACACAGGGRAGCSVKNFYGAAIQTKPLHAVLRGK